MSGVALRFDMDTVTCYRKGLDPLRRVLDRHGVRATFAVNAGRSIAYRYLLRRKGGPMVAKVSTVERLGLSGIAETVLTNPRLGRRFRSHIDRLYNDGHEIAVHGGRNHALWQYGLDEMSEGEIGREVEWGRQALVDYMPVGFVAPGHRGNEASRRVVASRFQWSSYTKPANVVGPHGMPIIEYLLAQGWASGAIVAHVCRMVRAKRRPVLYGHPCVEGQHAHILDAILTRLTR